MGQRIISDKIKVGVCKFKYIVPVVYKDTLKFASFIHSDIIKCNVYDYTYEETFLNLKANNVKRSTVRRATVRGVLPNETLKATHKCLKSLNGKIDKYINKGYLPLKMGWNPIMKRTLTSFNTRRRKFKLPEKQWTDIVIYINCNTRKIKERYKR